MKICITADGHFGLPGKLDDTLWAFRKIREYNREHQIEHWIDLGDLTHDREVYDMKVLCALTGFLEETATKYKQTMYTFPGNHNMYLKNSWTINSLLPLKHIKCFNGISKLKLGGCRFWILPFIYYESDYMKVLAAIEDKHEEGDVLLTHIGVKNAILNTCFVLQSWSVVCFSESKFDRVYTGHFHSHQQVDHNVWYPGSPIPFKIDEGDVDHGFLVFDTESRTHEFISIWDGVDHGPEVPPQFWTLDEETIRLHPEKVKGNIVRVSLVRDYTTNQLLEMKNNLMSLGARDVRWLNVASKDDKDGINLAKQATAASASELFERHMKADGDGIKDLDQDLLLRLNREIIAEGDRQYEFSTKSE